MKYLLLILLFSSCEVLKTKRDLRKDSVATEKVDSGSVKKTETETNKQKEYDRVTVNFPPQPRDCTINKYYTYPTSVVYEKGKETEQIKQVNYDSLWAAKFNELKTELTESTKDKKTGISPTIAIFIGLGIFLLFVVAVIVILYKMTTLLKNRT